jgi:hypothetical protein
MKIISFTETGKAISRNTNAAQSANWEFIYSLRRLGGRATDDQIKLDSGLDEQSFASAYYTLKHRKLITEE